MNAIVRQVPLIHAQSGDVVAAELRGRIEDHNLRDWRTRWLPILTRAAADRDAKGGKRPLLFMPGGGALDWPECVADGRSLPDDRASFAIECEGTTQGMMAVRWNRERRLKSNARSQAFNEHGSDKHGSDKHGFKRRWN
jgi:hypothetical protein